MSPITNKDSPLLRVNNLRHKYDEAPVLSINAWQLMPFEHQLLLGPSGSGKTTFLGIISGLLRPTEGSVYALDASITGMSVSGLSSFRARNIGFVFQGHHLISSLTILENLRLARCLANLPEDQAWLDHLLDSLDLKPYRDAKPGIMSHGEAQRAAIARAAAIRPILILADEPTSSLDDNNASRVMKLLKALSEEAGATMVVASHDRRLKPFFSHSLVLEKQQRHAV